MEIHEFVRELEAAVPDMVPGSLQAETRFRELPVWDSLASLTLLSVVDARFGFQMSGEQLRSCATVRDVFELAMRLRRG